jgi:hypothetical protein
MRWLHDPYLRAWASFRWAKIGQVTAITLFVCLLWFHPKLPHVWGNVLGFAWMLVWTASLLRVSFFRCPRCKKPFRRDRWVQAVGPDELLSQYGRECIHCGIKAGTPKTATE